MDSENKKASLNRTLCLSEIEESKYRNNLIELKSPAKSEEILNKTINQDFFTAVEFLPDKFVDLLFVDPPYNLRKSFNDTEFKKQSIEEYNEYVDLWLSKLIRVLKPTASVYICSDFYSSTSIHLVARKYLNVNNRITWQREKGRGAKYNWKNSTEDIWFCSMSKDYKFNIDRVKELKRVIAPYKENGKPKDWFETKDGNFRLTYPSNIWTDLTIPYWSMAENTEHPTQKPEKLLAKIILANSDPGDFILDPFLGSGTTSVTAKKLNRNYCGIEKDTHYCCLAEKRLELAESDKKIQGFENNVFWERNTLRHNSVISTLLTEANDQSNLFD